MQLTPTASKNCRCAVHDLNVHALVYDMKSVTHLSIQCYIIKGCAFFFFFLDCGRVYRQTESKASLGHHVD